MTPQLSLIPGAEPVNARKPHAQSEQRAALIRALTQATGVQCITRQDYMQFGRVCHQLEAPGRSATPEDIAAVAAHWKRTWPSMALTPAGLAKHYDMLIEPARKAAGKRKREASTANPDTREGIRAISTEALAHARRLTHLDGSAKRSAILTFLRNRRFPAARLDECADRIMAALTRERASGVGGAP